jgi:trimethyllysine dioxygenase
VSDCPPTPSATQSLLERIAFVQHTHYGGFWDFTSSSNPIDTAYTDQALALHTDTTYLTNPCGLQMFHLISHTGGAGGKSVFVDGFAAAAHLRDTEPKLYTVLHRQKVLSHASGNPEVGELENTATDLKGCAVFIGGLSSIRDPDGKLRRHRIVPGKVPTQIRWNNDDRNVQTWPSLMLLEDWYSAAREWSKILKMDRFKLNVQLRPGQPIIFDNWRYLHGRTAFSGKRRICGGYSKYYASIRQIFLPAFASRSSSSFINLDVMSVSDRDEFLCLRSYTPRQR